MHITVRPDGCWRPSLKPKSNGYVLVTIHGQTVAMHRLMFELFVMKIPFDKVIDHLCRNRWCCNPAHLEAVTQKENIGRGEGPGRYARRTHCNKGHAYDESNTYIRPDGNGRACKQCQKEATQRWRERDKSRRGPAR